MLGFRFLVSLFYDRGTENVKTDFFAVSGVPREYLSTALQLAPKRVNLSS